MRKTWVRNLNFVESKPGKGGLLKFEVVNCYDELLARITPTDLNHQRQIIARLDSRERFGWVDDDGNVIDDIIDINID